MAGTTLSFNILARDNASKTITGVSQRFGMLRVGVAKVGSGLGAMGKSAALGLGVMTVAAGAAAPKVLGMAANLDLVGKKSKTVFGSQLGLVQKWAKTNANAMGLTSTQATGLAANFADLLIPMGFTREAATKMSTDVVGLSGALAEWSGGTKTAAEVSEILSAAMLGETDGLKALGISIAAADIEARLLAKGQDKLTGATRQQAEAQAVQQLIMEKSTDAQAAFANGQGTLARKLAESKARFREFGEVLLTKATPALLKIVESSQTVGREVVAAVRPVAGKLATEAKKWAGAVTGWVSGIDWKPVGKTISDGLSTVDLAGVGKSFATEAKKWAASIISGVKTGLDTGDWSGLGAAVGEGIVKAIEGAAKIIGKIGRAIGDLFGKIDWFQIGKSVGLQAPSFAIGFIDSLFDGIIKVARAHPLAFWLTVVSIIFAPTKILKPIVAVLRRVPIVGRLIAWIVEGVNKLGPVVLKVVGFIGRSFMQGFRTIFPGIGESFGKWLTLLPYRLGVVAIDLQVAASRMMLGLAKSIARGIGWVVAQIGVTIARMLKPFVNAGGWLVARGAEFIRGLLRGSWSVARGVGGWILTNVVRPAIAPFARAGTWLYQRGRDVISGLSRGLSERWVGVTKWISGLKASVSAWLGDTGKWLVQKGRNVLWGFLNGLKGVWTDVTKWVGGIAKWIKDNKGPVSLDARLLVPAGAAIMSGFLKGLKSGAGPAWDFVKGVGGKSVDALRSVFGGNEAIIPGDVGVLTGPNRRVFYQGEALDLSTFRKIKQAEARLGEALNITQGSYERRTSYSGSTHTGGGVFDVVGGNLTRINNILRSLGFASWVRQPWQGPWPAHVHAIERGNTRASSSAQAQVEDFMRGGDGLAGYKQGTPWVPNDQIALLHKGEAVVPADVNARMRGGDASQFLGTVRLELVLDGKTIQTKLLNLKRTNGGIALGLS